MAAFLSRAWPSIVTFFLLLLISYLLGVEASRDFSVLTYTEPTGSPRFAQEVFLQASVAFLIALAVYEITERSYRRRKRQMDADASSKMLQATAQNVFGQFFDDHTIQAVTNTIFASPVVREKLEMQYVFESHPKTPNLLRMRVITEYELRNACPFALTTPIRVMVSNTLASHPQDPFHGEKSKIVSVEIDGKELSDAVLGKINTRIKPTEKVCRLSLQEIKLAPGKSIIVRSEIVGLKLANDSEVMQLIYPTKDVEITVQNSTNRDLDIDINGVHAIEFPKRTTVSKAKKIYRWAPKGVFLNNNGWVLFWSDLGRNLSD